jgi:hypothetical protein
LHFHLITFATIGKQATISSWMGLIAGVAGIAYGLKAKQFTAYGHLSGREREHFVPNWPHRLFVVLISIFAILISLRFLLHNR